MNGGEVIARAFGPGYEFWKSSTEESFRRVGVRLLDHGIGINEVAEILSELYGATADEYGA